MHVRTRPRCVSLLCKLAKENVSLILVHDLLSERVPVSTADNNHTAIETPLFVPIRATGIVARLVGHVLLPVSCESNAYT